MIAHRYLPVVCLLFACALVPTLIHSYSDDLPRDGRTSAGIATSLAGYTSTPTDRNPTWGQRRFGSDDWIERNYTNGRHTVRLTVARSFDPKSLYHHPELAIAYGPNFAGLKTVHLPERPDMPIHVLTPAPAEQARAAYVLHYRDQFVEEPILFQIRAAGELLVSRRQAMTIFFAFEQHASGLDASRPAGADLLLAAVDDFLTQKVDGDSSRD